MWFRRNPDTYRLLDMIAGHLECQNAEFIRRWQRDEEDRAMRTALRAGANALIGDANRLVRQAVDANQWAVIELRPKVIVWARSVFEFANRPPLHFGSELIMGLVLERDLDGPKSSPTDIIELVIRYVDIEAERERCLKVIDTIVERLSARIRALPIP